MRITTVTTSVTGFAVLLIAGCGGAGPTTSSGGGGTPTQAATASVTVATATVSGHGTVLVGGSNSMTLYVFDQDTAGSNTSACTGGCISTWPPLTVPAGTTPTAASGLTGQLSTFARADGKGTQVTYNGHPLYFYSGDTKPGDGNGNYPHWSSVSASGAAAPSASASGSRSSPSNPYGY